jgi:hypothetical protein
MLVAASAFASKQKITYYRNIIVPGYTGVAFRAVRRRKDNRFIFGDPVNADVRKTSKYQTE